MIGAEGARVAYIVGRGGHAHVIRSLLPHARIRFLVDSEPGVDDVPQEAFFAAPDCDADCFIGIGDNAARRRYFDRLKAAGLRLPPCIAPSAWLASDARIGDGAFLGPGAVVGARACVGENVIANTQASIDHDCRVGADSQIAPGVTLGGGVAIGERCFLGMRACVLPRVEIGDEAFVMAGALVVEAVPPGSKVGGVPARIRRPSPLPPAVP